VKPVAAARAWSPSAAFRWVLFGVLVGVSLYAIVTYQDNAYRLQAVRPATDFYNTIWLPGKEVLHGRNPYPAADSPTLAGSDAVYPPPVFVVTSPVSLLPFGVAKWLWVAFLAILSGWTFVLVGVRDPRCIGVAMISAPIVSGLMWGNATLAVGFAAALAWKFRDRPGRLAVAYAAGSAVKVFLVPLAVWLLLTGRWRGAVRGIALLAAVVLLAWAGIGFAGMRDYPAILRTLSDNWVERGLFLSALLAHHGWSTSAAVLVGALPAMLLFVVAWFLRASDSAAFGLTLIAILFLTPVNHVCNLELMLIAVACVQPSLSLAWLLMPLTWWTAWSSPLQNKDPDWLVLFSIGLAAAAAVIVAATGRQEIRERSEVSRVSGARTASGFRSRLQPEAAMPSD
jgi:hypothetical protein